MFEITEAVPVDDPATKPPHTQVEGDYLEVVDGLVQVRTTDGLIVGVINLPTNTMIRMMKK